QGRVAVDEHALEVGYARLGQDPQGQVAQVAVVALEQDQGQGGVHGWKAAVRQRRGRRGGGRYHRRPTRLPWRAWPSAPSTSTRSASARAPRTPWARCGPPRVSSSTGWT